MVHSKETRQKVLDMLADGKSVRQIAQEKTMPDAKTIHQWVLSDETFRKQYARACEVRADAIFDEMFDIADDATNDWMAVNADDAIGWRENGEAMRRSALRIDVRKWALARMQPKKYGDKLAIAGDETAPLVVQMIERRVVKAGN